MNKYRETTLRGTPDFPLQVNRYATITPNCLIADLHWHLDVEILYVRQGILSVTVPEGILTLHAGDLCFINPEELHTMSSTNAFCIYHTLIFSPSVISYSADHYFDQQFISPLQNGALRFPRVLSPSNPFYAKIAALPEHLFGEKLSKPMLLAHLTMLCCLLMEHSMMRSCEEQSYKRQGENIKRCIAYMLDHYQEKIKLEELAKLLNMTPNYFCSYFKSYAFISPFQQLNRIRIQKASTLLSQSNSLIAEIAEQCGFDNMSLFIRKFKEVTGYTPSTYRKMIKHSDQFPSQGPLTHPTSEMYVNVVSNPHSVVVHQLQFPLHTSVAN